MILSEHLVRCDTDGIDYNTHWYKWTIGRLQQVFLSVSDTSPRDIYTFYSYVISLFIKNV